MKAKDHGIDRERLGVLGMSAGGHLSLKHGTTEDDGDPKATDEVLRHSSRVAAGGGHLSADRPPRVHDDAPTLMVHCDQDVLVPIEHSKNRVPLFEKAGVPVKLVVREESGEKVE